MILVTTSHKPSPRTRTFVKDLVSIIPFSQKTNRGHKTLAELAFEAKRRGFSFLAIVLEKRGNPSAIDIYEVDIVEGDDRRLLPRPKKLARILLRSVRLSRENPEASRIYGINSIGVDYSKCNSEDCFFLADLLIKIFGKAYSVDSSLKLVLDESEFIALKCLNIHGKPVGPLLKVSKIMRGDAIES